MGAVRSEIRQVLQRAASAAPDRTRHPRPGDRCPCFRDIARRTGGQPRGAGLIATTQTTSSGSVRSQTRQQAPAPRGRAPAHAGTIVIGSRMGAFLGACVLGRLADLLGRKRIAVFDASVMLLFALASAIAPSCIFLVGFRFLLGFGVGGDYPVSAVLMSEYYSVIELISPVWVALRCHCLAKARRPAPLSPSRPEPRPAPGAAPRCGRAPRSRCPRGCAGRARGERG